MLILYTTDDGELSREATTEESSVVQAELRVRHWNIASTQTLTFSSDLP